MRLSPVCGQQLGPVTLVSCASLGSCGGLWLWLRGWASQQKGLIETSLFSTLRTLDLQFQSELPVTTFVFFMREM